jgi:hypothetical protein
MFREVTMIELNEVLRLWGKSLPKKRVAAQVGLDPKTVRRYLKAATAAGLPADGDPICNERVREVLLALHPVVSKNSIEAHPSRNVAATPELRSREGPAPRPRRIIVTVEGRCAAFCESVYAAGR